MMVSGSVYHPITYLYRPGSWILCKLEPSSQCEIAEKSYSSPNAHSAGGKNGAVSTSQHIASEVGLQILKKGGNAVDTAAAIGYALAVVDPCCGNLGGGGFMVIHLANGKSTFINFREKAPLKAHKDMYLDSNGNVSKNLSTKGYLAVGIPGTVAGLEYARNKYGSMPRKQVIDPAIALASKGFVLQKGDIQLLNEGSKLFSQDPNASKIFMKHGKNHFYDGDVLVQTNLSKTLKLIAEQGQSGFYKGAVADKIVAASNQNKGILTKLDFEKYVVEETDPVKCIYRKYIILSTSLPGGGTTLCQMLNILEGYNLKKLGFHSSSSLHYMLSSMLFAYSDRNLYLGDPNFINSPTQKLLSKEYAKTIRSKIISTKAISPEKLNFDKTASEGHNTTHYSVKDKFGNAVSVTLTINSYFGAGVIAKDTGFFLNNEMDDFTIKAGSSNSYSLVQGKANQIEPGKRPLSSMSPTIVLLNNKPIVITGSPGGSTIPNTVLQILLNIIDYDMSLKDAIASPRLHYQGMPDFVITEPYALKTDVFQHLWELGYKVIPYSSLGVADSVYVNPKTNESISVSDYRRSSGQALAY
jgi:gamma-glutamyltranspeptidase / glutathione hydrolase